ncbi:MAG: YajQ family cyclic di-GMP-binding protein [Fimbriimonadaceae bacterium]|nr:YajQ family cyclic di-GMP-binding protein [Fimbriimonadaceae bacterium]
MAQSQFSFDIVSRVNQQEVRNAVDQAQKELMNRWDLKGTNSEIEFEKDQITLTGGDEMKLGMVRDILFSKLIKRGIDARQIDYGKEEPATGMSLRQKVNFKQGIEQETGKQISKSIRDSGIKVNAQIQGDELRVSGKSKDDLQKAMALVKAMDLAVPVEFTNYR